MPEPVPLTTLLSWTWIAFTVEVDNAVEAAATERVGRLFRISLPMWTNGLRHIAEGGVTVDELRARSRAACNIGGLERWGWIAVAEGGGTRREGYGTRRGLAPDTVLRPTRAGSYARRIWPATVAGVEDRWHARFGDGALDSLRAALLPHAVGMPWSPPEVHPSDGFHTSVIDAGNRDEGERPLVALLGQALAALTIEQERDTRVSLPLGANALRAVDGDVVRTRDLPLRTGVSKEAIRMSMSWLQRNEMATTQSDRTVVLTRAGLDARESCRTRATRCDDPALRPVLEALLSQRHALAAGLVPPEGCWRARKPYVTQTQRLVSDPTGALPWHPMVLHRGGWPDGA